MKLESVNFHLLPELNKHHWMQLLLSFGQLKKLLTFPVTEEIPTDKVAVVKTPDPDKCPPDNDRVFEMADLVAATTYFRFILLFILALFSFPSGYLGGRSNSSIFCSHNAPDRVKHRGSTITQTCTK
eukprot:TRINITY_DN15748_c0_g1_i1.p1 TRINITY_DN15748_c0_g1~~TRINITY_DN15748_c0_g1_i1.p1  ORF type:complete len:127 (+),score=11.45 TRINITY_DN15748_c0_g1_i1:180-560(+)